MKDHEPRQILSSFRPDLSAPGAHLQALFETASAAGRGAADPWTGLFDAACELCASADMDAWWSCMGALQFLVTRPDHIPGGKALHFLAMAREDGRLGPALSALASAQALESRTGVEKLSGILSFWGRLGGLVRERALMDLAPLIPVRFPLLLSSYFLNVVRRLAGDDLGYLGQILGSPSFLTRLAGYQTIVQGNMTDPDLLPLLAYRTDPDPLLDGFRTWLADRVGMASWISETAPPEDALEEGAELTLYTHRLDPSAILSAWLATPAGGTGGAPGPATAAESASAGIPGPTEHPRTDDFAAQEALVRRLAKGDRP